MATFIKISFVSTLFFVYLFIMNEIYKPVPNFEGIYEISNFGNVRSCEREYIRQDGAIVRKRAKQRKLVVDSLGYVRIQLHHLKEKKYYKIHRLVLLTFEGYKNMPINHIDGNKRNNRIDNLEYCTDSHNNQHSHDNKLRPKKHYNKIICNETGEVFNGVMALSRFLTLSHTMVSAHLKYNNTFLKGLSFKYL